MFSVVSNHSYSSGQAVKLEQLLVKHCSPTLVGMKPASLVTSPCLDKTELHALIGKYNQILNEHDVYIKILNKTARRPLLFVYRYQLLAQLLETSEIKKFLHHRGYSSRDGVTEKLDTLAQRIAMREDFPHEIGVFLGYPLADVISFCKYRGRCYKFCGAWKVYHDVKAASQAFQCYRQCRERACFELAHGTSLVKLCQQNFIN